jgi:hypothetical protein
MRAPGFDRPPNRWARDFNLAFSHQQEGLNGRGTNCS